MRVTVVPCGSFANESERKAIEHVHSRLVSIPGKDEWILLTNLAFSVTHQLQSDEIDIVAIGPPGVRVIEVKHWSAQWVHSHTDRAEQAAELVMSKARKIGTTLRKIIPELPHVNGAFLLTEKSAKVKQLDNKEFRGVRFYTLNNWKNAIGFDSPRMLTSTQAQRLANALDPKSAVAIDGSLRRLAGYVNLELQTPKQERFHRVYKGVHSTSQDRVILHLYDLSASDETSDETKAETKARREHEALHKLQLHAWAPRIRDSFQDAPGYAGEMNFFTVVDPSAPCIEERAADVSWKIADRLSFTRDAARALGELHETRPDLADPGAARALDELHETETGVERFVHRNLTPETILVRHDNSPILTGFERTKIPADITVASVGASMGKWDCTVAPEVRAQGLGAADPRSDVYALCACLTRLFQGREDGRSRRIRETLAKGLAEAPEQRATVQDLESALSELLGEPVPLPAPPPARFWTEGQEVSFGDHRYRIVARLGAGGVGTAFKVVEIDLSTKEELGTYVGKVGHDAETGQRVLKSHRLARPHLGRHAALSAILQVAQEWRETDFIALMTWIDGGPLRDFSGVFPLLAEDQQESSSEALALRWLRAMCEALDVLHRKGLVHGDVSPRNMIVSGRDLVLIDYDCVAKIGDPIIAPGAILYCPPFHPGKRTASPADDIYALAASFFHVVFGKKPFLYDGAQGKERGLNWEGVDREAYAILPDFLNKATHPDPRQRFGSVAAARAALPDVTPSDVTPPDVTPPVPPTERRNNEVKWLRSLLQSYPGSRWGNRETRGLDTDFAAQTYVETGIEEALYDAIRRRRARLVILCGNAGDGKTALLQRLASRLGLGPRGKRVSSERILAGRIDDGLRVRMNLDGSAAWKGRSADELLDKFLEPFQEGPPGEDIAHLLAINDGRLLEWIENVEARRGETSLTQTLYDLLGDEAVARASHIRFISLNQRSLVGGITPERSRIETGFLERLLDRLYGGDNAPAVWEPCQTCSAQEHCEVWRATRVFGPDGLPGMESPAVRARARQRLFDALQAVHLRGETHITVRELRAALVYILFGVHFCRDYHDDCDALPYWERAFSPVSHGRQGELLRDLAHFDPALEAHPQIDRRLLRDSAGVNPEPLRRRAFFEWTAGKIAEIAGEPHALGLAQGRHLRLFQNIPVEQDKEKQDELCERLCRGISRLEDLPPQALDRPGVVPLRITPRTPTETAFWVEKPLSAFRLEADLPGETEGLGRLQRQASLIYRYREGQEERLRLGAELFHRLLELSDGYQLGDVSTDDAFAHLSIFAQRLVREDDRAIFAWNPAQDGTIYQVSAEIEDTEAGAQQPLRIRQSTQGGQE